MPGDAHTEIADRTRARNRPDFVLQEDVGLPTGFADKKSTHDEAKERAKAARLGHAAGAGANAVPLGGFQRAEHERKRREAEEAAAAKAAREAAREAELEADDWRARVAERERSRSRSRTPPSLSPSPPPAPAGREWHVASGRGGSSRGSHRGGRGGGWGHASHGEKWQRQGGSEHGHLSDRSWRAAPRDAPRRDDWHDRNKEGHGHHGWHDGGMHERDRGYQPPGGAWQPDRRRAPGSEGTRGFLQR